MSIDVLVRVTVNTDSLQGARNLAGDWLNGCEGGRKPIASWSLLHEHPAVVEGDDVDPGRVLRVAEEVEGPVPPLPVVLVPKAEVEAALRAAWAVLNKVNGTGGGTPEDGTTDATNEEVGAAEVLISGLLSSECPDCEGAGAIDKKTGAREWLRERCETCKGTGRRA